MGESVEFGESGDSGELVDYDESGESGDDSGHQVVTVLFPSLNLKI